MGSESDAVWINELFNGHLEELLRKYRTGQRSDREIAELLTAKLRKRAGRQGRVFDRHITQRSVHRWRTEVYGIE